MSFSFGGAKAPTPVLVARTLAWTFAALLFVFGAEEIFLSFLSLNASPSGGLFSGSGASGSGGSTGQLGTFLIILGIPLIYAGMKIKAVVPMARTLTTGYVAVLALFFIYEGIASGEPGGMLLPLLLAAGTVIALYTPAANAVFAEAEKNGGQAPVTETKEDTATAATVPEVPAGSETAAASPAGAAEAEATADDTESQKS